MATVDLGKDLTEKTEYQWNTKIIFNISMNKLK